MALYRRNTEIRMRSDKRDKHLEHGQGRKFIPIWLGHARSLKDSAAQLHDKFLGVPRVLPTNHSEGVQGDLSRRA